MPYINTTTVTPDPRLSRAYKRTPKGYKLVHDKSLVDAWHTACNDPDAAMRRVAVLHYPTILDTWAELGYSRDRISRLLGFKNYGKLRFWLWDKNLLSDFLGAYRDAADVFIDAADVLEYQAIVMPDHPAVLFAQHQYHQYTPKELRRMAGRNNPDKYNSAGKLKATPVSTTATTVSTTRFTGWTPTPSNQRHAQTDGGLR